MGIRLGLWVRVRVRVGDRVGVRVRSTFHGYIMTDPRPAMHDTCAISQSAADGFIFNALVKGWKKVVFLCTFSLLIDRKHREGRFRFLIGRKPGIH